MQVLLMCYTMIITRARALLEINARKLILLKLVKKLESLAALKITVSTI